MIKGDYSYNKGPYIDTFQPTLYSNWIKNTKGSFKADYRCVLEQTYGIYAQSQQKDFL